MRNSFGENFLVTIITFGFIILVINLIVPSDPKCKFAGCEKDAVKESGYCVMHDMSYRNYGTPDYNAVYENSQRKQQEVVATTRITTEEKRTVTSSTEKRTTTTKKKKSTTSSNPHQSYDDGYNDIYEEDDYDWDRYWSDDEYATGVDDAMDDMEWD